MHTHIHFPGSPLSSPLKILEHLNVQDYMQDSIDYVRRNIVSGEQKIERSRESTKVC